MVRTVIIMGVTQYGTLADDALEEDNNGVTILCTEDMILVQVTGYLPAAMTYQTRFMQLEANVILIKMFWNFVKLFVQKLIVGFLSMMKEEKLEKVLGVTSFASTKMPG